MRNKLKKFTRVEGGTMQEADFDYYEDQISDITQKEIYKKEVYCKPMAMKVNTRVAKIGKVWIHSLFFEDGKIYDADVNGFRLRETKKLKEALS